MYGRSWARASGISTSLRAEASGDDGDLQLRAFDLVE